MYSMPSYHRFWILHCLFYVITLIFVLISPLASAAQSNETGETLAEPGTISEESVETTETTDLFPPSPDLLSDHAGAFPEEPVELAALPTALPGFPVQLSGSPIRASSIALGNLDSDGVLDIVVGGSDGKLYAYRGNGTRLWEYDTGDMGIDGKAAIGDIDRDGRNEVVVGAGSTFTSSGRGGLYVLDYAGRRRCSFTPGDFNRNGKPDGVLSSPALADLDGNDGGKLEIAFGAWDGYVRVLNHDCTKVWEKFVRDTIWSSPAIGDIDGNGSIEIVIGADSHREGAPYNTKDGGILHVYLANGSGELPGFPVQIDETIYSSPVLGDINGDKRLEIMVGTGTCWSNAACAPGGRVRPDAGQYINAWDYRGRYLPGWPVRFTEKVPRAAPSLADIDEDGLPEVIINTRQPADSALREGWVYVLNHNGSVVPGWPVRPTVKIGSGNPSHTASSASPVIADVNGDNDLEIILPSGRELMVWSRNGRQLTRTTYPPAAGAWDLSTAYDVLGTPAVGDVTGDGVPELIAAGATRGGAKGAIYAWRLPDATSASAVVWPVFRYDAQNNALLKQVAEIRVSQTELSFLVLRGSRASARISITVAGDGQPGWSASANQPWLGLSASTGTTPAELEITVNATGQSSGVHAGVVILSSEANSITIPVRMVVADQLHTVNLPLVRR